MHFGLARCFREEAHGCRFQQYRLGKRRKVPSNVHKTKLNGSAWSVEPRFCWVPEADMGFNMSSAPPTCPEPTERKSIDLRALSFVDELEVVSPCIFQRVVTAFDFGSQPCVMALNVGPCEDDDLMSCCVRSARDVQKRARTFAIRCVPKVVSRFSLVRRPDPGAILCSRPDHPFQAGETLPTCLSRCSFACWRERLKMRVVIFSNMGCQRAAHSMWWLVRFCDCRLR